MVDLDRDLCPVSMNIFTEFEKTWQIVVMIDAQLCGSVGALRGIDACVLYDDEPCAHRHHNNTVLDSHIFNG